ncbi:SRPBCC domain-containing protein [Larkinella harenae]
MKNPLIKEFHYKVPREQVWRALTEPEQMKQWYFPQLRRFEPVVGFVFQFDDAGAEYRKEWVVTSVTEGRTFAHSWAYKGYAGKSEVLFELVPENDQTRLRVTQTNLESFPPHPHFNRERFEWGWEMLLGNNLKVLLENGTEPAIH